MCYSYPCQPERKILASSFILYLKFPYSSLAVNQLISFILKGHMLLLFVFTLIILSFKRWTNLSQFTYHYRKVFTYYCREAVKPWQGEAADTSSIIFPLEAFHWGSPRITFQFPGLGWFWWGAFLQGFRGFHIHSVCESREHPPLHGTTSILCV